MSNIFVSVIIPTRNRPHLLKHTLQSVLIQKFENFEVIVCDNSDIGSANATTNKKLVENLADQRFHYIQPSEYLNMSDNWEFAYQTAKGEYIAYLSDRTVFYPSTLEHLHLAAIKKNYDIISWREDIYIPEQEYDQFCKGYVEESGTYIEKAQEYNPMEELRRRYKIGLGEGLERNRFFRGKICFGAYSRILIDRIKSHAGRLFFPLSCDYTSRTLALYYAKTAIDLGIRLSMQIRTELSSGQQCRNDPDYNLEVIKELNPDFSLKQTPLPGIYYATINTLYSDYVTIKNRFFPNSKDIILNTKAITLLAQEELLLRDNIPQDQVNLFNKYLKSINLLDKIHWAMAKQIKKSDFRLLLIWYRYITVMIYLINRFAQYIFFFKGYLEKKMQEYILCKEYIASLCSRRSFDSIEEAIKAVDNQNNNLPTYFYVNSDDFKK